MSDLFSCEISWPEVDFCTWHRILKEYAKHSALCTQSSDAAGHIMLWSGSEGLDSETVRDRHWNIKPNWLLSISSLTINQFGRRISSNSSLQSIPHSKTQNLIKSIMPRGNSAQVKVHYAGKEDDFIIFVDNVEAVQKWKEDRSIPLAQVISGFKIFITHKYVASFFFIVHSSVLAYFSLISDTPIPDS